MPAAKEIKFRKPSPKAAYLVADVTPEEAKELGLIVVENDALGFALSYGKYP